MKKTKIICTMGPNTNKEEMMRALVQNGMDIARFNFCLLYTSPSPRDCS